ncbi:hypothetical protein SK128_013633, partial [Halocaridina rubra]
MKILNNPSVKTSPLVMKFFPRSGAANTLPLASPIERPKVEIPPTLYNNNICSLNSYPDSTDSSFPAQHNETHKRLLESLALEKTLWLEDLLSGELNFDLSLYPFLLNAKDLQL